MDELENGGKYANQVVCKTTDQAWTGLEALGVGICTLSILYATQWPLWLIICVNHGFDNNVVEKLDGYWPYFGWSILIAFPVFVMLNVKHKWYTWTGYTQFAVVAISVLFVLGPVWLASVKPQHLYTSQMVTRIETGCGVTSLKGVRDAPQLIDRSEHLETSGQNFKRAAVLPNEVEGVRDKVGLITISRHGQITRNRGSSYIVRGHLGDGDANEVRGVKYHS
jgi:hypothetical protein